MTVLGVDPGSQRTGYGLITSGTRPRLLAGGVIRTGSGSDLPGRLKTIHEEISAILASGRPDVMAVESVFNARNPRSSLILGHARGVILLAGAVAGIPIAEYTPREVKKALTGNGAASKEQVRFMVRRLLGIAEGRLPLDQSDALAVALTHGTRTSLAGAMATGGR
jgi:crossover junction endodeoxyribonuclease RuvC